MNTQELAAPLRTPYTAKRGFGLAKADAPGYENIWFVVPPPPPRRVPEGLPLRALGKASAVLARQRDLSALSPIDKLLSYYFVRREAVESSRLEGAWSTIDEILTPGAVQNGGANAGGGPSVRGYADALETHLARAADLHEKIFTQDTVRRIHAAIVAKDANFRGEPGVLRAPGRARAVVQIGGSFRKEESTYNPAPPAFVASSLKGVLDWLADGALAQRGDAGVSGFTLPVRLALAHAHFEAVHPFSDGNGRVGRALWPLQMACSDKMPLYLSGFVEAYKTDYARALESAQKKLSYGEIVEFICEAIIRGDAEASVTRAAIEGLPALWKTRAKFRGESASLRALEVLQRQPIVTIALLVEQLKLTKQAVRVALDQLAERGIVRNRGRSGRTQIFAAEELISLLSRPFGSDPAAAMEEGRRAMASKP